MDTRTRTASPNNQEVAKNATPPPTQDKISAYYSLVFPHFTFYIQTLSITIGRRCAPNAATSSTAEQTQVDVDLGALKSVSRLHAKIEYDQDEDRFVLVVIGRNGAWVDGVWSGAGTRAPLGERSQIQIASRTFHFVLPPPPPPEDTPSPSSQSSTNRPRSPSVDITSISPPSSQPSHSPPPLPEVKLPPPSPSLSPQLPPTPILAPVPKLKPKAALPPPPQLPNSNAIGKSTKANPKKRKKSDVDPTPVIERPKPEDMPPKPPYTYAQLIYRAIRDIDGKATLQEICNWIIDKYEYYRYADGAWMSSVRHNLSSGRAFLKMERCGGDRGKGFFWSIDEKYAQALEEQESKATQAAAAAALALASGSTDPAVTKGRKKDKGSSVLEPPFKRSVKGDTKNTPLPPPLTSSPLAFKSIGSATAAKSTSLTSPPATSNTVTTSGLATTGVFAYPSHPQQSHTVSASSQGSTTTMYSGVPMTAPNPYAALAQSNWNTQNQAAKPQSPSIPATNPTPSTSTSTPVTSVSPPTAPARPATATATQPPASGASVPDVVIPIELGPIPSTHPDYAPGHPNNSAKEGYMVLHERKLILDPDVFAELTPEMLTELEKMGARAALGVLTNHMIRALKERRARGRGKDRTGKRPKGTKKAAAAATTAPFTNVPLDQARKASAAAAAANKPTGVPNAATSTTAVPESYPTANSMSDVKTSESVVVPPIGTEVVNTVHASATIPADPGSPIIVVDGDSDDEGPAAKKRKMEGGEAMIAA
ncbi:hypothetical protein CVT24_001980 [Panaeolus cyanescens]|uniref:Fork-head domain-containing protein n=1 Tax=Panaeolus cyanescens TaxID=181874 RepID=A0A409YHC9_9AGAR|nr:hypothetical protein CVT24_001980 [Panaeolus cyanescens]